MSLHKSHKFSVALRLPPLPGIEDGLSRLPFLPLHPQGVRRDCKGLKPQQRTQAGERWIGGVVGEGEHFAR
jgi:hypothetical protein